MEHVDRLGWAASSSFRVGSCVVGVRSNTARVDGALQDILERHVEQALVGPRNYSVQIHTVAARGRVQPFNFLFKGCTPVLRTRSARELLANLLQRLEVHARPVDGSVLRLEVAAYVRHGYAVLTPRWMAERSGTRDRLRRRGFAPVEGGLVELELGSGHLLVSPRRLDVDAAALERWCMLLDAGRRAVETLELGSYPVSAWVFVDRSGEEVIRSKPEALTRALTSVRNAAAVGGPATLGTLAMLLGAADAVVLPRAEDDVAGFIDRLAPR